MLVLSPMNSHLNLNTVVTDGVNSSLDEDNEDEEAEEEVNKYHFRKLNTDNINNDYVYNMNCEPSVPHHTRQRHHQMLTKRPRLSIITSEQESFHNQINTTNNNNNTNQHHMNCSQLHQRDLIITSTSTSLGYTTNADITNSNENNNGDNPYTTFRSLLLQSDYNTNDNSSPEKENRTSILTLKSRLNHYVSDDDDDDVDDDVPDNEHVENMSTSESNLILHEAHNIDRFPSLLKHNSHIDYHQVLNDESVSNRNDELHEYKVTYRRLMINHHIYKVGESKFHHNEDYWLYIMKKVHLVEIFICNVIKFNASAIINGFYRSNEFHDCKQHKWILC
ncbi:unnamed protein product [Schistosoma bovis]|nr:unnamed protein product [Schistosoma bovis]CAH8542176.1 unnamed protein product [Schistosoma bovis]